MVNSNLTLILTFKVLFTTKLMWTSWIFLPFFLALAVDRESQGTLMCIYLNEVLSFDL